MLSENDDMSLNQDKIKLTIDTISEIADLNIVGAEKITSLMQLLKAAESSIPPQLNLRDLDTVYWLLCEVLLTLIKRNPYMIEETQEEYQKNRGLTKQLNELILMYQPPKQGLNKTLLMGATLGNYCTLGLKLI